MKIADMANMLANRINQAHYVKHVLKMAFLKGSAHGAKRNTEFTIAFCEWVFDNFCKHSDNAYYEKEHEFSDSINPNFPDFITMPELFNMYLSIQAQDEKWRGIDEK